MELYFKQRLLSFFDSFDIYDEDDNVIYTVEVSPRGSKLHVLNAAGEHIATVRQGAVAAGELRALVARRASAAWSRTSFAALVVHATVMINIEGDVRPDHSITASTTGAWRHFPRSCSTGRIPTISPSRGVRRMSFRPR